MGHLLVVTGPPGAGKSSVARILADMSSHSVLVAGDAFFGFLAAGRIDPWLSGSHEQNTVVTRAAARAAGEFAAGGYATVYDGVVGPWFLDTFGSTTGLDVLDYVVLLPPVDTCVSRVENRHGHGFTDEAATRHMHAQFANGGVEDRHIVRDPAGSPGAVAELVGAAQSRGDLTVPIR